MPICSIALPRPEQSLTMDLAHEPALQLGALEVRPSTREVIHPGGAEIVEPRVMAVLVALARADGRVVTRDELTEACWEGRVVSDDAINRVISRIRRISDLTGGRDFTLETITKIGYRLLINSAVVADPLQPAGVVDAAPVRRVMDRRLLLGAGLGVAISGGAIAWRLAQPAAPESPAAELYRRAIEIGATDDPEEIAQSISFLREAVSLDPAFANAWAGLALAYAYAFVTNPPDKHAALAERAKDAASRALAFDPGNADALGALALLPPAYQRWPEVEAGYREALAKNPPHAPVSNALANLLASTGRIAESVPHFENALRQTPLIARRHYELALIYWYAGRIDDADRASRKAYDLWPLDTSVWFGRLYQSMYGGDVAGALAMLTDAAGRPTGVPESDFKLVESVARAMQSGSPAERGSVVDANMAAAHNGLGYARNTVFFATALGDLDAAFDAASAYFFDRPFPVAQTYFTREQGEYLGVRSRETMFLFAPPLASFRADARFDQLVSDIGLEAFWRAKKITPDYRRA